MGVGIPVHGICNNITDGRLRCTQWRMNTSTNNQGVFNVNEHLIKQSKVSSAPTLLHQSLKQTSYPIITPSPLLESPLLTPHPLPPRRRRRRRTNRTPPPTRIALPLRRLPFQKVLPQLRQRLFITRATSHEHRVCSCGAQRRRRWRSSEGRGEGDAEAG